MSNFNFKCMNILSFASGITHWQYKIMDNLVGDIIRPGFFTDEDAVNPGDTIMVCALDGAAHLYVLPGGETAIIGRTPV